jgi:hypothetical protein
MGSITADELYEHVEVLADDVYEGRAAGSRGGHAASQYIVKQLKEYPLSPAGTDGNYVQRFDDDWRNILLLLPGEDPHFEREVIVVGAHYDHVGYGTRKTSYGPLGKIHNGADDNASGVSVLLETIEAFANSGLKTRRSILFAFWDGEEHDLRGSKYWLAHPTIPDEHVKLSITLDMVGRLRHGQLFILGSRSGYGLRQLTSGVVEEPMWLDYDWELSANSDHWPFLKRNIPVVLLHTGMHKDYHRPSDDVQKVNRVGMQEVSRYLLSLLIKAANADTLPRFRPAVKNELSELRQRSAEQLLPRRSLRSWPANEPRPRLGISWRGDEAEPGTVFLTRVIDGTPADAAGLAPLDRIQDINGQPFVDASDFEQALSSLLGSNPARLTFRVERAGHVKTVTVKFGSS